MDSFEKLQIDIMSAAGLDHKTGSGFYELYCPVCGKKDKKTGGFRLEPDKIGYNCFRASCTASCVFEKDNAVPKKFRQLMDIIGVKIPADLKLKKSSIQKQIERELESELYEKHTYDQIKVPKGWEPLDKHLDRGWWDYFVERKCRPQDYYIITEGPAEGLAAIPQYHYDRIIGFQVANPFDDGPKYWAHNDGNTDILAINGGVPKSPCIIVEGVIDAECHPHAVGVLGKKLSPKQAYLLRGKEKIFLPDKRNGDAFLEQAKEYGGKVFIPPWKEVGDLNDCVVRYGVIATTMAMKQNLYENPTKAYVAYRSWQSKGGNG